MIYKKKETATEELQSMRVLDYEGTGRKIVQWAQDRDTCPKTMEEFREQLKGLVEIPERYTDLEVVQGDDNLFVLRLPAARQVSEFETRVKEDAQKAPGVDSYDPPFFYMDMLCGEKSFNNIEFFYSRIGDYAFTQCR